LGGKRQICLLWWNTTHNLCNYNLKVVESG
jgi:hypothetical protein